MRRDLPAGTVTFLFTDVEGSTKLLHELGAEAYAEKLAEHREVVREACTARAGVEVDTQGDAFFLAFPTAPEATEAARAITEELASGLIALRIGLHTGTPLVTEEGYVGEDVHFAARVAASAHGGQVVLSQATRALLDEGYPLLELGEHRLKDIPEPVAIFQLGEAQFPPLKTISNTNLPRPASSFVGREKELQELLARIQDGARLLTLTGPGGSGKTRLALEAAATLVPEYKAGVFWVGLASLRDPALMTEMVAQTLGAKDGLAEHIGEREMLLLLDNLEQVIEAAPELSSLLQGCPNLTLLATSRELLRVQGEVEYPVPPLGEAEAVTLFCERAQTEPSAEIAELCRRLDSLPLAVELAAARTKALSPAQILERLAQRLDLLKGGRDADPRQQTLRATIEWSYDLLSAEERDLFRRLAVFAGGCILAAAEEVCNADLDTLQSLVEKSLLRFSNERYWMLETIREYARELLEQTDEDDKLRAVHADHFVRLAEDAQQHLISPDADSWLARLDPEHDNIRASLAWALRQQHAERALRLCGALHGFWYQRDHVREGRDWAERALALPTNAFAAKEKALGTAGEFALIQGDIARARTLLEERVAICRSLGDSAALAFALTLLGHVSTAEEKYGGARELYEQSYRLIADRPASEAWGPTPGVLLNNIGFAMVLEGNFEGAREVLAEALTRARSEGNKSLASGVLNNLGDALVGLGQLDEARLALTESLHILTQPRNLRLCAAGLESLARLAMLERRVLRAARLHGAASTLREAAGVSLEPGADEQIVAVEEAVNAAGCSVAVEEGAAMTPDEAVEYALGNAD
jgi:predicted ATPase